MLVGIPALMAPLMGPHLKPSYSGRFFMRGRDVSEFLYFYSPLIGVGVLAFGVMYLSAVAIPKWREKRKMKKHEPSLGLPESDVTATYYVVPDDNWRAKTKTDSLKSADAIASRLAQGGRSCQIVRPVATYSPRYAVEITKEGQ
nr:hypothetical protein [Alcaligenes faecalis]